MFFSDPYSVASKPQEMTNSTYMKVPASGNDQLHLYEGPSLGNDQFHLYEGRRLRIQGDLQKVP